MSRFVPSARALVMPVVMNASVSGHHSEMVSAILASLGMSAFPHQE
nr:hypothetical protein [Microtetraspora sp. NBRC 16547]